MREVALIKASVKVLGSIVGEACRVRAWSIPSRFLAVSAW